MTPSDKVREAAERLAAFAFSVSIQPNSECTINGRTIKETDLRTVLSALRERGEALVKIGERTQVKAYVDRHAERFPHEAEKIAEQRNLVELGDIARAAIAVE